MQTDRRSTVLAGFAALAIGGLLLAGPGRAQEPRSYHLTEEDLAEEEVYSPFADRNYPDQVLFGDAKAIVGLLHDLESPPAFATAFVTVDQDTA